MTKSYYLFRFFGDCLEELNDSDWEPEPEHAEDEEGEQVGDDGQANMAQTVGKRLERQNRGKAQTPSKDRRKRANYSGQRDISKGLNAARETGENPSSVLLVFVV